jgi:hypothetical protein
MLVFEEASEVVEACERLVSAAEGVRELEEHAAQVATQLHTTSHTRIINDRERGMGTGKGYSKAGIRHR